MGEKKESCEARTLIALMVGVGFGVVIGVAVLVATYPFFQSKDWAAWVQAFGSIGAISMTGFVFNKERKIEAHRAKSIEDRKRKEMIEQLKKLADFSIKEMAQACDHRMCGFAPVGFSFRPARLDQLRTLIENLAVQNFQSEVTGLALDLCDKIHEIYIAHENFEPGYEDECSKWMRELLRQARKIRVRLDSY